MKELPINQIIYGEALEELRKLSDESIDCCVTSPPYWALRDYQTESQIWDGDAKCEHKWIEEITERPNASGGKSNKLFLKRKNKENFQEFVNYEKRETKSDFCSLCGAWRGSLGLEPNFELYIKHLCNIFDEIKRVLKKTGTCFVNLGDTYSGSGCGTNDYRTEANKSIQGKGKNIGLYNTGGIAQRLKDLPAKSLCNIPARFSIEMQNRGWILRNTIIWHKPNCMPSSAKDRFTIDYEFVFFFVKSKKYWFETQYEDYKTESIERLDRGVNEDNKWKNGADGQTKHTMNQPRLNIKRMPPIGGIKQTKGSGNPTYSGKQPLWTQTGRNKRCVWEISEDFDLRLSPKYTKTSGHSNRQGLNRPLDIVTIKAYKEYQEPIAKFLKTYIKPQHKPILDETFGRHAWPHWLRTDLSGAALPGVGDWFKLKEILKFDDAFDDKIYEVQKFNIPIFSSGKKRCVWRISTQPFKEAHFAVFPEKLIEPMVKAGCPEFVCNKCGKIRKKIFKKEGIPKYTEEGNPEGRDRSKMKWNDSHPNYNPRWWSNFKETGYSDCGCGEKFEPGIILDPFIGSGTTAVVAKKLKRNYIGIDLSEKYCEMARKRIKSAPTPLL